ncbi:hypothetical protein [Mixta gaviniae]|uniref:Uncharacterized protein n=1 Tax=Mixta gaviniae TaxID=665914 RepID=A0A2L0IC57_9GAMM|nr:hypothetical protein [Mixta gaviniae]AUX92191.1 hypothetical protein C2E15_03150 [Mixta gaviniae]
MRKWLALIFLGMTCVAQAAERNDIPSCYHFLKVDDARPADSGRELVIVIDQTVKVPLSLKESVWQHVLRYVQPGDRVVLYQFSALLQDNYLKRAYDGRLEAPFTDQKARNSMGMESLKKLDSCLVQQKHYFSQGIGKVMAASFAAEGDSVAKSEIFGSLKRIAADLKGDPATEKSLLLVSDMLENSDFVSFYSNNRIRAIVPDEEMAKVTKQALIADFDGARVYVAGAGLIDTAAKNNYRSGKVMQQLETFWQRYFEASHAELVSFGAPELTVEIK